MSYIRIKWIKGHPYLYEQESYRVGNKVKTRSIRYVGRASAVDEFYNLTLYRGSSSRYATFDMTKAGTGEGSGVFGKGVYLTDNKDVADFYALQSGMRKQIESYTDTGIFGTLEPVYTPNAEALAQQTKVINVFKVKGKLLDADTYQLDSGSKQVLIDMLVEKRGDRRFAEEAVERAINFSRTNADKIYDYKGELRYVIDQTVGNDAQAMAILQAYFKQQGYDGVKFQGDPKFEGAKGNNYLIFDPSKVKPAHSPQRKDSR